MNIYTFIYQNINISKHKKNSDFKIQPIVYVLKDEYFQFQKMIYVLEKTIIHIYKH